MDRGFCLTTVIEPVGLPKIALLIGNRVRGPPVRSGKNFRAADGNDPHFQLQGLAAPAPVGIDDHLVLLDFYESDQAAIPAVLDAHPHPDGEVFTMSDGVSPARVSAIRASSA
jgi:hypothetical protein